MTSQAGIQPPTADPQGLPAEGIVYSDRMTTVGPVSVALSSRRITWMHGRRLDLVLMFCWVPLAMLAGLVGGNADAVQLSVAAVLLVSLAHQPITMALVYAEPQQFRQRRRLFIVAPVVLMLAIYFGLRVSVVLVAVIGAAWNTEHTLMQRYGIVRIYRRKGGDTSPGRLDLHLLMSWLLATLAWVVADPSTSERIESLGLRGVNQRGAEVLVDVRPAATALLLLGIGYAVVATTRWLRREAGRGFDANPAVYLYVAGTAGLFLVAVINPIAGFVAWVGSHAIEYFIIVSTNLNSRYPADDVGNRRVSVLGRAVQSPLHSIGVIVLVTVSVLGVVQSLVWVGSLEAYQTAFFLVGALHILYDGFIWKLRQPQVARSFAIDS